jgi:predicted molibdopterin-dependent oxidoreductase YjgC
MQVEKSPKPVASCAMPAGPGMKIKTDTPLVKKAREGVMEFLLVRHTSIVYGAWDSVWGGLLDTHTQQSAAVR